jgi:hypothetical protein
MRKYVVVSIGNSDDKLSQIEWSKFVTEVHILISQFGSIHFFGGSPNYEMWQNAAWLIDIGDEFVEKLKPQLSAIREKYKQESAFFLCGDGEFI